MPEKPEVITVSRKLKEKLLNKKIISCNVYYDNIIEYPSVLEFTNNIKGETFRDFTTRGKWIVMKLDHYYLLAHLRMEGKFYYRDLNCDIEKHHHVVFNIDNSFELHFVDVRKFGRLKLIPISDIYNHKPFKDMGLEYDSKELTVSYLKEKFKNKKLPIKTALLDQTIISGIGNIYSDEILFLSLINPHTKCNLLNELELDSIIKNTKKVLDKAIIEGGTTIRSYTSMEGVMGNNQKNLLVYKRENDKCFNCGSNIIRDRIGGRSSYYCLNCQKLKK